MQILLAVPVSLLSGWIAGIFGFGSGIISIQGMVRLPGLRLTQLQACATSLGSQAISTCWGGCVWFQGGCCDLALATCLAVCGLPGVALGQHLAVIAPEAVLRLAFAGVLCFILCPLTVMQLLEKKADAPPDLEMIKKRCDSLEPEEGELSCDASGPRSMVAQCFVSGLRRLCERPAETGRHCVMGTLVGVLTGSIGIGDTPVFIAYLVYSGLPHRTATGTAMLATVPTTALGAILHTFDGNCIPVLVMILTVFMSLGAGLGAKFSASKLSEEQLKLGFAAMVLFLGLFVGWESFCGHSS